jgi:hypothetical protein
MRPSAAEQWLNARLSPEEQRVLQRQGYVAPERLPSGRTAFKLRYRDADCRQRAVYIGVDQRLANLIAGHLAALQESRRAKSECRRLMAESTRALRAQRAALSPLLAQYGYTYHGFALRRSRRANAYVSRSPDAGPTGPPSAHHRRLAQ